MDDSLFGRLPDELLEAVVLYLSPRDTISFGSTCSRGNKITHEALVWRRHCIEGWQYWESYHELEERLARPPVQTRWRELFNQRKKTDEQALVKFDALLLSQQYRIRAIEELSALGYDIKDLMLKQERETPRDAADELARKYHAKIIRAKIHREIAIKKWNRLSNQQMVSLDEALGAYDLFALAGEPGDLDSLSRELDRLAQAIRTRDPEFDDLPTRTKATRVASFLRSEDILGNDQLGEYHALRNNYVILALLRTPHRSLPLQSAAIYCGVARRLGVDAKPSNFPNHVYVVVRPPRHMTLDGRQVNPLSESQQEYMHMDPWRSSHEVEQSQLVSMLTQMGTRPPQYASFLGPASTIEIALRAGRNIMNSVTEARNRLRLVRTATDLPVDVERAWYSMLWATMLLVDNTSAHQLSRRRSCLPYLMEHHQVHFPEDLGLLEQYIAPMIQTAPEHEVLMQIITVARTGDQCMRAPCPRQPGNKVKYKIGSHFRHRRYDYTGAIVGWDTSCEAGEQWINQMRVNDLPKGRNQPFYHVLAADQSIRYVAQENIKLIEGDEPIERLLDEAGRYFKRWDARNKIFVSNITEDFPDD